MNRTTRMFEIIQLLRARTTPMTAAALAEALEVSKRTVYRDITALQAMRVPVEGEAGLGYVMRRGYDLPPLNFDDEEIEALRVGLSMLARSGDLGLVRAGERVRQKIEALNRPADWLQVSPWGAAPDDPDEGCVPLAALRDAVRRERKIRIRYKTPDGAETTRVLRPLALVYHLECVMVAGWCELRSGFRHFRTDRIFECDFLEDSFTDQSQTLRQLWIEENQWSSPDGARSVALSGA